ncbi:MAG: phosphatase PAP2 family protein [Anaerolineae bacterium]|nr:phosphatase PAP2 family protein [Anaerolineae bacterium]
MGEWLESLVPWGTEVLVQIQFYADAWVITLFALISPLGSEPFYVILLPVIYWCVSRRIGVGLGILSLSSAWLNSTIKYIFAIPRPADPRLDISYPETSPSFLSGHAQGAAVNWGYLAIRLRSNAFRVVAIVLIVAIGLSRMVLAVHFPQDVIAGWLVGLGLLALFVWAEPRAGRWIGALHPAVQIGLAVALSVVLIFLHPADTEGLYPAEGAITPAASLAGLGVGVVMERAWVRFRADGAWGKRALRLVVGLIIVGILYVGPRLILPESMPYGLEATLRFVRYAVLGWAVAFPCPWLFVRLGLAEQEGNDSQGTGASPQV